MLPADKTFIDTSLHNVVQNSFGNIERCPLQIPNEKHANQQFRINTRSSIIRAIGIIIFLW